MLVDSHLHLNMVANNLENRVNAVKQAISAGISHLQLVSTDFESFFSHMELQGVFPHNISVTLGFGPNSLLEALPEQSQYLKIIAENSLTAIGEIGLDYYHNYGSKEGQREFFSKQLQLAQDNNLPVVVHTREADSDTLAVLRNFPAVKGVIHCFSSDVAFGEAVIDLGYLVSFSGNLTFKRNEKVVEAAQVLPLEKILLETDAPFLSPVPMRGKPNLPVYLIHTAEFLAKIRSITLAEVATATTANFFNLFKKDLEC